MLAVTLLRLARSSHCAVLVVIPSCGACGCLCYACSRSVMWCLCLSSHVVLHIVLTVSASHHVMLCIVHMVGGPTVMVGETAGDM
jgi:hypothetical protein